VLLYARAPLHAARSANICDYLPAHLPVPRTCLPRLLLPPTKATAPATWKIRNHSAARALRCCCCGCITCHLVVAAADSTCLHASYRIPLRHHDRRYFIVLDCGQMPLNRHINVLAVAARCVPWAGSYRLVPCRLPTFPTPAPDVLVHHWDTCRAISGRFETSSRDGRQTIPFAWTTTPYTAFHWDNGVADAWENFNVLPRNARLPTRCLAYHAAGGGTRARAQAGLAERERRRYAHSPCLPHCGTTCYRALHRACR